MACGPIAILGATSQIALDVLEQTHGRYEVVLYARRPEAVLAALAVRGLPSDIGVVRALDAFGDRRYGAILNFIGIGDPSKTAAMGAGILDATSHWDERVLAHLADQPDIPYVFMSSGAVYGDAFDAPVTTSSDARFPINALGSRNWYALAKLIAEVRHRAMVGRTIVDIRIFNYISRTLDKTARFLVTDMIRAIESGAVFETTDAAMTRDYLHPVDLAALIECALDVPRGTNIALDAFTRSPITKVDLLALMSRQFGLRHRIVPRPDIVNATGSKPNYLSLDRTAARFGYAPTRTSAEAIVEELRPIVAVPTFHVETVA